MKWAKNSALSGNNENDPKLLGGGSISIFYALKAAVTSHDLIILVLLAYLLEILQETLKVLKRIRTKEF